MTAPNDPLEFVQDFEPVDDADVLADAPCRILMETMAQSMYCPMQV